MKAVCAFLFILSFISVSAENKTFNYTGMDGNKHNFMVYSPEKHKSSDKVPCVIFFHGGGWTGGSLNQFKKMCEYFASRGMVAITADYSMHRKETLNALKKDESKKRICIIDGKSLIRRVINDSSKLGIDSNNIVVGGASAGGHISVLSVLDQKYSNPEDSTKE